jgi:hypothetical protein
LPDAHWVVDETIGGNPDTRSALEGAMHLSPSQALLIIHSAGDTNSTTSLAAAEQLYEAAQVQHKTLWIAPLGGHAGALAAQPAVYQAKVMGFLHKYLVDYHDASPQSLPDTTVTPAA